MRPVLAAGVILALSLAYAAQPRPQEEQCTGERPGKGLLAGLSKEHNASLLWGSYRPGVYFGLRSRTAPLALAAGLVWSFRDGQGRLRVRHQCEESDQLSKYGWGQHDGMHFGNQQIEDPAARLQLNTSFVKRGAGWHARVQGANLSEAAGPVTVLLYFSFLNDSEAHTPADRLAPFPELSFRRSKHQSPGQVHLSTPEVPGLPGASVVAPAAEPWSPAGLVLQRMLPAFTATLGKKQGPRGHPLGSTVGLQYTLKPPFSLDFGLISRADATEAQAPKRQADMSGPAYERALAAHVHKFERKFDRWMANASLPEAQRPFAQYSLSALVGGLGYFYGQSIEKGPGGHQLGPAGALFSAVPCRPFFPRGFLWDEGFHQLVLSAWEPALAQDVLAHWFEQMRPDGWVPREQILGVEAITRVPAEFVAQSRGHANPPTLLLVLHKMIKDPRNAGRAPFFRAVLPAIQQWFKWFERTQRGSHAEGFLWRGRDPGDGKLNAMTLSSGLDDYPRASVPSEGELHLDLHCWLARAARVIADLAQHLGEQAVAREYSKRAHELAEALDRLHWNPEANMYQDWGLHDTKGSFAKRVVVQCESSAGEGRQVAVDPSKEPGPQCPRSHPHFKWPLGDGHGGLLQREVFVSHSQRAQFVEHVGYVSLFPLMLRVLSPEAPQLAALLSVIRGELWTPYGLRSLSNRSRYYQRENAPGDAPYWRGPIWINMQYLALSGLHHYAHTPGRFQGQARAIYKELRHNVVHNLWRVWRGSNFLWEQYSDRTGEGQRARPFNGWSSTVVLMMAEDF